MAGSVSLQDIISRIKSRKIPSLILLYGPEDYYCEHIVVQIKKEFLDSGSEQMDFCKIDCDAHGFSLSDVIDNASIPPWLSTKRIVLVRKSGLFSLSDSNKKFSESFQDFSQSIPESSIVIFWEDTIDKRKKSLVKAFETNGLIFESQYLDDLSIANKVTNLLRRYEITITNDALDSLISRSDKSMRIVLNEITKIIQYCQANSVVNIGIDVIDELCMPDIRGSVFNMTDSISSGRIEDILQILDNLIIQKEPVARIKFMLAKHIRQLICAKELGSKDAIVRELGVHPYTAQKLASQAPRFQMDKLITLYSMCAKSDYEYKQGKIDERLSLEILLVYACKSLS